MRRLLFLLCFVSLSASVSAQPVERAGTPVILNDVELFRAADLADITGEERARLIGSRYERIAADFFEMPTPLLVERSDAVQVTVDGKLLFSIHEADAELAGKPRRELLARAVENLLRVRPVAPIVETKKPLQPRDLLELWTRWLIQYNLTGLVLNLVLSFGLVLLLVLLVWVLTWVFNRVFERASRRLAGWTGSFRIGRVTVLDAAFSRTILLALLRLGYLALSLGIILFFVNYILALFPGKEFLEVKPFIRGALYTVMTLMVGTAAFRALRGFFAYLEARLRQGDVRRQSFKFQNITLLTARQYTAFLESALTLGRWVTLLTLTYFFLGTVFSFFDFTRSWAGILFGYVARPVSAVVAGILDYLPNLFFIVVIGAVTYYAVPFSRFVFKEVQYERVKLSGFYPEWAMPTHRLVAFGLFAFAAVIMFPYLPGSGSEAFRGISLFLGFMLSLGSSAVIANVMAGVVITYMRSFHVGDRVKIADTVGDVVARTLLVTRIRTVKNVDITIPNGTILASHIINYSSSITEKNHLILHTSITIGYDVDWRVVHELLLGAVAGVEGVLSDPKPYVLQTSLDDYYVSYELNASTDQPARMSVIYSDLHARILDAFHERGVEIMSPHFYGLRDAGAVNIPERFLKPDYAPPPFRIRNERDPGRG